MFRISPFDFSYIDSNSNHVSGKKIYSEEEIVISGPSLVLVTGLSGAGKSTFLGILKGIVPHLVHGKLNGKVFYQEEEINAQNFETFNQKIVYLYQNPFSQVIHQHPLLEVAFTSENLKIENNIFEKKLDEIEPIFGLKKIWNNDVTNLSNGECQKMVLASLVMLGPEVILLDEPTSFLNPASRKIFYEYLVALKKNHLIILVDHHLNEIEKHSDFKIQVHHDGRVEKNPKAVIPVFLSHKKPALAINKEKVSIEINDLTFKYNKKRDILNGVNLKVSNSDVVVIKGENGVGKSSLFKLIAGLLRPCNGKINISVENEIVKNKLKYIGYVFQNPENNFFFPSLILEFGEAPRDYIDQFFNPEELERSPFMFSEGQKRRISILIQVFSGKKILIYDEPTFGQDDHNRNLIINLILELKYLGYVQMIISHDDDFIHKIATDVLELVDGKLLHA